MRKPQGSTLKQMVDPELIRVATAMNLEGRQALAITQSASTCGVFPLWVKVI